MVGGGTVFDGVRVGLKVDVSDGMLVGVPSSGLITGASVF
jgi:hypothetical protein